MNDLAVTQPEKLDLRSHDVAGDRIAELLRVFPEVRTEGGKLDFERLKLALTPRACLREALGQLLAYAFWPGAQEPARLIVAGESALDKEGEEYLRRLRNRFSLPIEYEQIPT